MQEERAALEHWVQTCLDNCTQHIVEVTTIQSSTMSARLAMDGQRQPCVGHWLLLNELETIQQKLVCQVDRQELSLGTLILELGRTKELLLEHGPSFHQERDGEVNTMAGYLTCHRPA